GELPQPGPGALDVALYESDPPVAEVIEGIAGAGVADVSLLLTGPPGTGKTALAWHLARRLDRPLVVMRASDLLSKWVGETEANIADAFA
ncbi:AAA family ATPase, partial [Escherichia coli]|nr:AAA family ATPase [Escherichia coli]